MTSAGATATGAGRTCPSKASSTYSVGPAMAHRCWPATEKLTPVRGTAELASSGICTLGRLVMPHAGLWPWWLCHLSDSNRLRQGCPALAISQGCGLDAQLDMPPVKAMARLGSQMSGKQLPHSCQSQRGQIACPCCLSSGGTP